MRSLVVLFVGAVLAVHGAVKETPAKGYYDNAQSQAAYPPVQQSPPTYYQPVYQPPQFALPNVDVNYCTVHASFPLAERRHDKNHHHKRDRRQAYGQDYNGVQQSPPAGYASAAPAFPPFPFHHHHHHHDRRHYERQHCRYTAIYSQAGCQTCCQIASAAMGSDTSSVTGALVMFDPDLDHDDFDFSSKSREKSSEKKDKKRVLQCICCLPKPV